MQSNTKKRQANFELLRIISMILIVIFHFSDWGGIININSSIGNKLFGEFINIGGKLGVNLFVLISGYFLSSSKFKIKKLLKILLEVWFYSVGIAIICFLLKIGDLSKTTLIRSLLPVTYNMYWFVTSYVGLYLLFPFINKLLNNLDRKKHKTIIILLGLMISIIPTFMPKANPFNSNLIWFVYVYIIATYISKYDMKFIENNRKNLIIIFMIAMLMFISSVICTFIGYKIDIFNRLITHFNTMYSLPMLILSIYVFAIFKNIHIKNNIIISTLARSSFAVYLIHINAVFRGYLFKNIIKIQNFYEQDILILVTYVIMCSVIIYLVCTVIDMIRIKFIEEPIFKIKKFDEYFNEIDKLMEI